MLERSAVIHQLFQDRKLAKLFQSCIVGFVDLKTMSPHNLGHEAFDIELDKILCIYYQTHLRHKCNHVDNCI